MLDLFHAPFVVDEDSNYGKMPLLLSLSSNYVPTGKPVGG